MNRDEFYTALTRTLDSICKPDIETTRRRTTPDDERAFAERAFELVSGEWATIASHAALVRALVATQRLSSIDERSRALMRKLEPPLPKEAFMAWFARQLEQDSHRAGTQQTRIILDSELEVFAKNLWVHMMRSNTLRRSLLFPFFLKHPRGFANEQDCADALLAHIAKS